MLCASFEQGGAAQVGSSRFRYMQGAPEGVAAFMDSGLAAVDRRVAAVDSKSGKAQVSSTEALSCIAAFHLGDVYIIHAVE